MFSFRVFGIDETTLCVISRKPLDRFGGKLHSLPPSRALFLRRLARPLQDVLALEEGKAILLPFSRGTARPHRAFPSATYRLWPKLAEPDEPLQLQPYLRKISEALSLRP